MTFTVTLVFGNELQLLPAWFARAFAFADEIVCAAHHPTDGSLEYVQKLAEGKRRPAISVRTFPEETVFEKGFSFMKNAVAAEASCDWIIALDADEELVATRQELERACSTRRSFFGRMLHGEYRALSVERLYLEENPDGWTFADAEAVKHRAVWKQERQWRIFRRDSGIRWTGLIHEELHQADGKHVDGRSFHSPIVLFHYSKLRTQSERDVKDGLYAELILRIVENPALRSGTNAYWYTTYYEQNKENLLRQRDEYRKAINKKRIG